jgi:hypothetical protein
LHWDRYAYRLIGASGLYVGQRLFRKTRPDKGSGRKTQMRERDAWWLSAADNGKPEGTGEPPSASSQTSQDNRCREVSIHLMAETQYGLRAALLGIGRIGAEAMNVVAASPLAASYEEWQARAASIVPPAGNEGCCSGPLSGGISMELPEADRNPDWLATSDPASALATIDVATPTLILIAADGDDPDDLAAAAKWAEALMGEDSYAAVFAVSRGRDLAWPAVRPREAGRSPPDRAKLSRVNVLAPAGCEEACLGFAVLAVLGAARSFGVIGVDMADVEYAMFGRGDGYALSATLALDHAECAAGRIEWLAAGLGLDLRKTRSALISVVLTPPYGLPELDLAVGSLRNAIGDGPDPSAPAIVMAGQYLEAPGQWLRATLVAFVD